MKSEPVGCIQARCRHRRAPLPSDIMQHRLHDSPRYDLPNFTVQVFTYSSGVGLGGYSMRSVQSLASAGH